MAPKPRMPPSYMTYSGSRQILEAQRRSKSRQQQNTATTVPLHVTSPGTANARSGISASGNRNASVNRNATTRQDTELHANSKQQQPKSAPEATSTTAAQHASSTTAAQHASASASVDRNAATRQDTVLHANGRQQQPQSAQADTPTTAAQHAGDTPTVSTAMANILLLVEYLLDSDCEDTLHPAHEHPAHDHLSNLLHIVHSWALLEATVHDVKQSVSKLFQRWALRNNYHSQHSFTLSGIASTLAVLQSQLALLLQPYYHVMSLGSADLLGKYPAVQAAAMRAGAPTARNNRSANTGEGDDS